MSVEPRPSRNLAKLWAFGTVGSITLRWSVPRRASGPRGRRFESCLPDWRKPPRLLEKSNNLGGFVLPVESGCGTGAVLSDATKSSDTAGMRLMARWMSLSSRWPCVSTVRVGVTKDLLRVLHRYVVLQEQHCRCVAQVMEANVTRLRNRPEHHAAALRTLRRLRFGALL
jgi:hypothetical protein